MSENGRVEVGADKGGTVGDGGVEEVLDAPDPCRRGGRGPWRELFGNGADVGP